MELNSESRSVFFSFLAFENKVLTRASKESLTSAIKEKKVVVY